MNFAPREEYVITYKEAKILSKLSSAHFGSFRNDPSSAEKRLLIEKAIAHLDNVVIQDVRTLSESKKKEACEQSLSSMVSKKKSNLNPFVFLYLGHYNLLLERIDDALSAYKEYQDRSQNCLTDVYFLYGIALCFFRFDCYNKSIEIFKDILFMDPLFPRCADIHFRLGFAFSLKNMSFEKSLMHFQRSLIDIDNNPLSRFEVFFQIASLFERQGRTIQALDFYQDLLMQGRTSIPPSASHHCYQKLGYIYQKLYEDGKETCKQYAEKAIHFYRSAIEIDPNNAKTWYYLGRVFASLGNIHDAFMTFRNSIDKAEADADTWCSIGTLYQQQSQSCDALQAYFCAVQIDSKHSCAWKNLGVLYESSYQYTDALHCYEKAIAADKSKFVCSQEFCDRVKQIADQVNEIGEKYIDLFQSEIAQKLPSVSEASQLPIPAELTHRRSLQLQQAEQTRSSNGPSSNNNPTLISTSSLYQLNGHGIFGPPNDFTTGPFHEYLGFSAFASQDMLMVPTDNDMERRPKPDPNYTVVDQSNGEVAPLNQMQLQWMNALQQIQPNLNPTQRQQLQQLQNQYIRFQQQQRQMQAQQAAANSVSINQPTNNALPTQQGQFTSSRQGQCENSINIPNLPPPPSVQSDAAPPTPVSTNSINVPLVSASNSSLAPLQPLPFSNVTTLQQSLQQQNNTSVTNSQLNPPASVTPSQPQLNDDLMDFSDRDISDFILYSTEEDIQGLLDPNNLDMDVLFESTTTNSAGNTHTSNSSTLNTNQPDESSTSTHSDKPLSTTCQSTHKDGHDLGLSTLTNTDDLSTSLSNINKTNPKVSTFNGINKTEEYAIPSTVITGTASSSGVSVAPIASNRYPSGNQNTSRLNDSSTSTLHTSNNANDVNLNCQVPSLIQELLRLNHPYVLADGVTMRDIVEPNICMSSTEVVECMRQVGPDGRKRWSRRLLPNADVVPRPSCKPSEMSFPKNGISRDSLNAVINETNGSELSNSIKPHPFLPSVHALYLESKKESESDIVQEFCLSLPVVVMRNLCHVLRLDMTMFSSKHLADSHPGHPLDVLRQYHSASNENTTDNSPNFSWQCDTHLERSTIKEYAEYQAKHLIQAKKGEKKPNGLTAQEKILMSDIRLGFRCDLSDYSQWTNLTDELAKLPPFLRVKGPQNMLSFIGYDIPTVNTIQLSMKVPGCRHYARQECLNYCLVNMNTGPGDCEWYCVDQQYWGELYRLCLKNNVDYLRGSWWPNMEDLIESKIPIYRFIQRPGDLVWVNTGTIYWILSIGFCNNISWNVGPLSGEQYESSMERYEFSIWENVKPPVPMLALTWNLARGLVVADRKLYELMRHTMMRCLIQFKQTEDLLNEIEINVTCHGHETDDSAYYCEHCQNEIFGHIFTKRESDSFYHSYCLACALRMDSSLQSFVALAEYSLSDLQAVYDHFHFRTEPIPAFSVSKN